MLCSFVLRLKYKVTKSMLCVWAKHSESTMTLTSHLNCTVWLAVGNRKVVHWAAELGLYEEQGRLGYNRGQTIKSSSAPDLFAKLGYIVTLNSPTDFPPLFEGTIWVVG